MNHIEYAKYLINLGVGEILLQNIDLDGTMKGFDIKLINDNNYTYLGITNNFKRRLRQHNGEIKGGAKYTHSFKGNGIWECYLHIVNLNIVRLHHPTVKQLSWIELRITF